MLAHVAIYIWVININLLNTVNLKLLNVLKKYIKCFCLQILEKLLNVCLRIKPWLMLHNLISLQTIFFLFSMCANNLFAIFCLCEQFF